PPPPTGDSDYRSNAHAKPPFSYATLICMAMEASKEPKTTLAAICKWISDNFCYFRRADPTWQRSIRHNLCINKRFVKVPREKGEPGRGAFWKLHPRYAEQLGNSTLRERRRLPEHIPAARQESRRVRSPAARICGSRSRLEVGAELQRLLREFEEFESGQNGSAAEKGAGQQLPQPRAEPEVSGLEQSELTELKGSADWEDLLNPRPEQGEFPTLGHPELPPPVQPGAFPLRREGQGQQQILPGASPGKPGLDETLMATAFLEAAWPQESGENLPDCALLEQGAGNTQGSLLEGDAMDWESLSHL
ncbi:FXJ1B protein, partial [Orthonyx spaldingii]|nr:FXJ1B protein [Orthonyx spaldingii]